MTQDILQETRLTIKSATLNHALDFFSVSSEYNAPLCWPPSPAHLINDIEFIESGGDIQLFQIKGEAQLVGYYHPTFSFENKPYVCFGYWEGKDKIEKHQSLFNALSNWAKKHSVARVVGPINGATAAGYRLRIGGFDKAAFYQEPCQPRYYKDLLTNIGFNCCETYTSWLGSLTRQAETFRPLVTPMIKELKEQHSISFIPLGDYWKRFGNGPNSNNFEAFLSQIQAIAHSIFEDNIIYSPMTLNMKNAIYGADYFSALCPYSSVIALKDSKEITGFFFTVPDYNQLNSNYLSNLSSGQYPVFSEAYSHLKTKCILAKTGGVSPGYRRTNIFTVMSQLISEWGTPYYTETGAVMVHENNPSAKLAQLAFGTENCRRYGLYERSI